jgi:hypothetical protein
MVSGGFSGKGCVSATTSPSAARVDTLRYSIGNSGLPVSRSNTNTCADLVICATASIRFPSRDCAIEEGVLRQVRGSKDLPSSTQYSVFHVRDNGQWRIAASREWGAGQDRLDDLEWLLGTWKGTVDKEPITLTLERDDKQSCIIGKTTRKKNDKETIG